MASDLFREELNEELPKWTEKKLITSANAKKISNLYKEKPIIKEPWSQEKLIKTLIMIASIVIGIGVLLYVASNWDKMAALTKTILLGIATFGTLFAGYYYSDVKKALSQGLFLLSSLIYGGSVFLISQIYHISGVSTSTLFFIWFLGAVLIAYFFDCYPALILSTLILTIWNSVAANYDKLVIVGYPVILFSMLYLANKKLDKSTLHFILTIIFGAFGLIHTFTANDSYWSFGIWALVGIIYAFISEADYRNYFLGLLTSLVSILCLHFSMLDHLDFYYVPILFFILIGVLYYFKNNLLTIFSVGAIAISSLTMVQENYYPTLILTILLFAYYLLELNFKRISNVVRNITLAAVPVVAFTFCLSWMDKFEALEFSFPILMIILLVLTYKERSWIPLIANTLMTVLWSFLFFIAMEDYLLMDTGLGPITGLFFIMVVGLLLTTLGLLDHKFRKPYFIMGLPALLLMNFILTFHDVVDNLVFEGAYKNLLFVLLGLCVILSVSIGFFKNEKMYKIGSIALLIIGLLGLLVLIQPTTVIVVMNLIFFGAILLFLYFSFIKKNSTYFNISLVVLGIYLIIRYFDFAWKLFDRSLFFIITGIILLLGALILDKFRRIALKEMKS